jgi:hypothetical protein
MTKSLMAAAVIAALTTGAYAEGNKQQSAAGGASGKQAQRGASSAGQGTAAIVLVPFVVAQAPDFSNGCWARLYDGANFQGDQLTVVGPADMPNMRTAFGTDWSGSFDSVQVGPKATVTVYDNENYTQKVATYEASQRIADLDEKRGMFQDIRSLKIACAGGAATGGSSPSNKGQRQQR